jgi:squalene-hopene/tetraprenyl-beta-curcumene cyclase
MSLVAAGESASPVVTMGLEFLRRSVRADGSWPIDSNLATWVTTLSVNALSAGDGLSAVDLADRRRVRDWLLAQQWRVQHPYTGAAPGGWAWTDLPGGVPDADDTAGALIALAHLDRDDSRVRDAAAAGVGWLLDLQNRDGGIPTFCRGWGALPFDRSSCDLTAHALRAWMAWAVTLQPATQRRVGAAIHRGVGFLADVQRPDGTFVPLWFGNQHAPEEENPVFGTSRVIAGLAPVGGRDEAAAAPILDRALAWLLSAQNRDGGWGGAPSLPSTLEESGVAISGLAAAARSGRYGGAAHAAVDRGAAWLIAASQGGRTFPPSPLGLYFARLWYSEQMYPLMLTAGALEAASGLP